MEEIKIVKLTTSEEIICFLVEDTDTVLRVKKPMGIGPSPEAGGLLIYPWSVSAVRPSDEDIFEINRNCVVMVHKAPAEVASSYRTQTSRLYVAPTVEEGSLILG
jgi:hypothetical protein